MLLQVNSRNRTRGERSVVCRTMLLTAPSNESIQSPSLLLVDIDAGSVKCTVKRKGDDGQKADVHEGV